MLGRGCARREPLSGPALPPRPCPGLAAAGRPGGPWLPQRQHRHSGLTPAPASLLRPRESQQSPAGTGPGRPQLAGGFAQSEVLAREPPELFPQSDHSETEKQVTGLLGRGPALAHSARGRRGRPAVASLSSSETGPRVLPSPRRETPARCHPRGDRLWVSEAAPRAPVDVEAPRSLKPPCVRTHALRGRRSPGWEAAPAVSSGSLGASLGTASRGRPPRLCGSLHPHRRPTANADRPLPSPPSLPWASPGPRLERGLEAEQITGGHTHRPHSSPQPSMGASTSGPSGTSDAVGRTPQMTAATKGVARRARWILGAPRVGSADSTRACPQARTRATHPAPAQGPQVRSGGPSELGHWGHQAHPQVGWGPRRPCVISEAWVGGGPLALSEAWVPASRWPLDPCAHLCGLTTRQSHV